MRLGFDTEITWLGHATFNFKSPKGKSILIDPWVMNNPLCPEPLKQIDNLDVMLITHGHFDHIADAVAIARDTGATVVAIPETAAWLRGKGLQNIAEMNKGGTQEVHGVRVTMTHAVHSCGITDDDGSIIYGGEAAGYIIEFENGFRVYHAGDTAVFSDMQLIGELYEPNVCLLPIGDHYVMSPAEAAKAITLLKARKVIPMHFGTFPVLKGTPEQLRNLTKDVDGLEIASINPGETLR